MPHVGGESFEIDMGGPKKPIGRPPSSLSGSRPIRAESPNPPGSNFSRFGYL